VKESSLCGLGTAAPNPVLSTLQWFRDEYEAHLSERRCPAGVCGMDVKPLHLIAEELLQRVMASRVNGEVF